MSHKADPGPHGCSSTGHCFYCSNSSLWACEATCVKIGKNVTDFFQEMLLRVSLPIPKCPLWRTNPCGKNSLVSVINSCFTEQPVGFYFIGIGKTDLKKNQTSSSPWLLGSSGPNLHSHPSKIHRTERHSLFVLILPLTSFYFLYPTCLNHFS